MRDPAAPLGLRPAAPLGLRPAAPPDPAVVAMVAAAVWEVWPRPPVEEPAEAKESVWRFSGRWWSRPLPTRRARPLGR